MSKTQKIQVVRLILLTLSGACAMSTLRAEERLGIGHSPALSPPEETASGGGSAADDETTNEAELAKKLQNPIANLISVPIQNIRKPDLVLYRLGK